MPSSAAQRIAKEAAQKRRLEEEAKEASSSPEEPLEATDEAPLVLDEEKAPQEGPEAILSSLSGGPSKQQIKDWKETFSSVYALSLRDDDWYIWRYLELGEWKDIQSGLAAVEPDKVEEWISDQVLKRCIIWPREKVLISGEADRQPAGLKNLLYEVVMAGSYFMPTEQALRQTLRL